MNLRYASRADCVYSLVGIHWVMPAIFRCRPANVSSPLPPSCSTARASGAMSVDAVAAKAGVTKRTLYYHFKSKDDLVAAYLEARDQPNLVLFKRWFAETPGGARRQGSGSYFATSPARSAPSEMEGLWLSSDIGRSLSACPAILRSRRHQAQEGVRGWLRLTFEAEGVGDSLNPRAAGIAASGWLLCRRSAASRCLLHRDRGRGGVLTRRSGAAR